MLVLFLVLFVTGCGTETDKGKNTEGPGKVHEIGASLTSGPVLLNVAGAGYHLGDIVRIKTAIAEISKGDVILAT